MKLALIMTFVLSAVSVNSFANDRLEEYAKSLGWKKSDSIFEYTTDTGWFADKYKNCFRKSSYHLGKRYEVFSFRRKIFLGWSAGLAKRHHLYYDRHNDDDDGIVGIATLDLRWGDKVLLSVIPSKGINLKFETEW